MEDGMKGGNIYRRWNEGRKDYIEYGMKGGKIIWKMEWREGRLYGRWKEGREDNSCTLHYFGYITSGIIGLHLKYDKFILVERIIFS